MSMSPQNGGFQRVDRRQPSRLAARLPGSACDQRRQAGRIAHLLNLGFCHCSVPFGLDLASEA